MKFYTIRFSNNFSIPEFLESYPCVVLMSDNWNDFGYETYYHFYYILKENISEYIGASKILNKDNCCTRFNIPSEFEYLDKSVYCSLGQNLKFYESLISIANNTIAKNILNALNDVAVNDNSYLIFKNYLGFHDSLIRWSEAQKALKEAKMLFGDSIKEKNLHFTFSCKLKNATLPHKINLDFDYNELPYRINAFVGKNATGKTKILTELAMRISGVKQSENNNFIPEKPSFSKVIAISYSAFDDLYKPFKEIHIIEESREKEIVQKEEASLDSDNKLDEAIFGSYVYCGIHNSKGLLNLEEIEKNFFKSYSHIVSMGRLPQWEDIMTNILEEEHLEFIERISGEFENKDDFEISKLNSSLSSGQNIMLATITEVIANIEKDSILLFDEPELHLHPNAISNFMRMIYEILKKFDSYAVLSTHSPLIIQEIPSKYIHIFNRSKNTPYIISPDKECFGENINVLTNDIFEVREHESNYTVWFKGMKEEGHSLEFIEEHFNGKLSYNASVYLNTLYSEDLEEE